MAKPTAGTVPATHNVNDLNNGYNGQTGASNNVMGVASVKYNPNIYNPGCWGGAQWATVPYQYRYNKYQQGPIGSVPLSNPMGPLAPNTAASNAEALIRHHNWQMGDVAGQIPEVALGRNNTGQRLTADVLASAYDALAQVRQRLAWYDGWFDGNGVCQRSCQVNCQVGCQVACQGCNNGTCHDQKCGGH